MCRWSDVGGLSKYGHRKSGERELQKRATLCHLHSATSDRSSSTSLQDERRDGNRKSAFVCSELFPNDLAVITGTNISASWLTEYRHNAQ
jgi:hypothetical protein